ncbi:MAG: hypothetical protein R2709_00840 [Marmoricola sp.]
MLDQIGSLPEVILTAKVFGPALKEQAGRVPVNFRLITTGRPATASTTSGVAVIALSEQGPLEGISGSAMALAVGAPRESNGTGWGPNTCA